MSTQAARIAELEAQLAAATAKKAPKLSLKVSAKGAVSLYGVGRFPVTLYQGQWQNVAACMPQILDFIAENKASLSSKD